MNTFLIKTFLQINLILLISVLLFMLGRRLFRAQSARLVFWAQGILILSILSPLTMQLIPQENIPIVNFVMPKIYDVRASQKREVKSAPAAKSEPSHVEVVEKGVFSEVDFTWILFGIFIVGLAAMLFRFLQNYLKLRCVFQNSIIFKNIGKVIVAVSDDISVPLSAKILRKAWVVLPTEILGSKKDLRIAVTHELQHHRQGDTLWAMIMEWLVCFFYINPAIYLWKKEITELQEYSCDEALIGHKKISSHDYGSCLVRVAEAALRTRQMHVGTMCMAAGSQNPIYFKSFLRRRIEMLSQKTKSVHKWTANMVGTAAIVFTVSVAFGTNQKFNAADRINPGEIAVNENIQKITEKILKEEVALQKAKAGFVIVADPHSGKILAVANVGKKNKDSQHWALSERFEPASIAKTLVIAEALDKGVTTPQEKHACENGNYTYNGRTYHDWKDVGWSYLTTEDTLAHSSNICMIKIGEKLGDEKLMKMLEKFAVGPEGITKDFPEARSGVLPSAVNNPQLVPAVTSGFGMKMTPLEILQAYGAIANGGNLMAPLSNDSPSKGQVVRRVLSPEAAEKTKEILRQVVVKGTGKQKAESELYTTAGKTGTGYIPDLTKYYLVERATQQSNFAGFVGFAPVNDPKVEVFVAIYEPQTDKGRAHGSTNAAPVFRRVVDQVLQEMKVAPDKK